MGIQIKWRRGIYRINSEPKLESIPEEPTILDLGDPTMELVDELKEDNNNVVSPPVERAAGSDEGDI